MEKTIKAFFNQAQTKLFPSYSGWLRGLFYLLIPIVVLDLFGTLLAWAAVLDVITIIVLVLFLGTFIVESVYHGLHKLNKHGAN